MFSWMYVGEIISNKIKLSYVRALLRQDLAFYDMEASRELSSRLGTDINVINEAVGEKVGTAIQKLSQFISSMIIAFIRGPRLALVALSCIPALTMAAAFMSIMLQSVERQRADIYSVGDGIVREVLLAIRTVVAFTAEDRTHKSYTDLLQRTSQKMMIRGSLVKGVGIGMVRFVFFSMYALVFWYGSVLVINSNYSGT